MRFILIGHAYYINVVGQKEEVRTIPIECRVDAQSPGDAIEAAKKIIQGYHGRHGYHQQYKLEANLCRVVPFWESCLEKGEMVSVEESNEIGKLLWEKTPTDGFY